MISDHVRAVVLAFYSPARKAFLPLLTHEVAKRAKLYEDHAKDALSEAYEYGWASHTSRERLTTWELTPKGEKAARTLREAAEVVRSA